MVLKKVLYVIVGFAVGFVFANFFLSELKAQDSASYYTQQVMTSKIPSAYGKLIAISGTYLYFQGDGGTIYILRQRTQSELDSRVIVIKRS